MVAEHGPDFPDGRCLGAVLVGTGPDVAGIGSVEDALLWAPVAGHPVMFWSLRALLGLPRIRDVVLLVASGREAAATRMEEDTGRHVTVLCYPGTGSDPLLACLRALSPHCDLVILHYANRPLISASSIDRGITVAEEHPGSGVVASEPVRETIKRADGSLVIETLPRVDLVLLHSPQIYPCTDLIRVYSGFQSAAAPGTVGVPPERAWLATGATLVPFYFSGGQDREGLAIASADDLELAEVSLGERE